MMLAFITGTKIVPGISAINLPKKYALTVYILLLISLRNTGLSSGNRRIIVYVELNAIDSKMK